MHPLSWNFVLEEQKNQLLILPINSSPCLLVHWQIASKILNFVLKAERTSSKKVELYSIITFSITIWFTDLTFLSTNQQEHHHHLCHYPLLNTQFFPCFRNAVWELMVHFEGKSRNFVIWFRKEDFCYLLKHWDFTADNSEEKNSNTFATCVFEKKRHFQSFGKNVNIKQLLKTFQDHTNHAIDEFENFHELTCSFQSSFFLRTIIN